MKNILSNLLLALLMMTGVSSTVMGGEHKVLMLDANASGQMVFEPELIHASVGDTVTFIATDWGHNAESIVVLQPEGVKPFYGKIDKPVTIILEKEGVYVIQCNPHALLGMVAVIVADRAVNLEKKKADARLLNVNVRQKRERLNTILARIE